MALLSGLSSLRGTQSFHVLSRRVILKGDAEGGPVVILPAKEVVLRIVSLNHGIRRGIYPVVLWVEQTLKMFYGNNFMKMGVLSNKGLCIKKTVKKSGTKVRRRKFEVTLRTLTIYME